MVYALVALGISLIFSGLDVIHFAHGEIYMLGAFIGLMLFRRLRLPYIPTLMLRVIITGLVGVIIERVFYRRLTQRGRRLHGRRHADGDRRLRHVDRAAERRVPDLGPEAAAVPGAVRTPHRDRQLTLRCPTCGSCHRRFVLMRSCHLVLRKTHDRARDARRRTTRTSAYLSGVNVPLMISSDLLALACRARRRGRRADRADQLRAGADGHRHPDQGLRAAWSAVRQPARRRCSAGCSVGVDESLGAGYVSGTYKDIYAFILLIVVMMVKPSGILGVEAKVKA
jgi:branched-chain amino acid transport system permease protein